MAASYCTSRTIPNGIVNIHKSIGCSVRHSAANAMNMTIIKTSWTTIRVSLNSINRPELAISMCAIKSVSCLRRRRFIAAALAKRSLALILTLAIAGWLFASALGLDSALERAAKLVSSILIISYFVTDTIWEAKRIRRRQEIRDMRRQRRTMSAHQPIKNQDDLPD